MNTDSYSYGVKWCSRFNVLCAFAQGSGDCSLTTCARGYDYDTNNITIRPALSEQAVKADAGKPKLSLVPMQILYDIARVREYGVAKYGDPENWRNVEAKRYIDALLRHTVAFARDPEGLDEESGLTHLAHVACNVAFLCELLKKEDK